jgi:hypothetical protein
MPTDRPILVVGCPRSGTTMLQLMLHAHPRIALPPENRFVLAAYERRHEFGDLRDPANRRALGRWIAGTQQFEDLGLGEQRVIDGVVAAPPADRVARASLVVRDRFGPWRGALRDAALVLRHRRLEPAIAARLTTGQRDRA